VASAPHSGPTPAPNPNNGGLDQLNARLNALLPGGPVAYSNHEYVGDLQAAIEQAQEDYFKAAAPPPQVLAKALYIVRQRSSLVGPASIVYVLKRQTIFGIPICTGWRIAQPADGGPPQGGYTFGACGGDEFTPRGGLPTLPPKPVPS
jgi:hypothetical protein